MTDTPYKVLGLLDDPDGVGVLGQNDADTGTPVGVRGEVHDSSDGYGLATPDDARVKGVLDTGGTDFVVEADDGGTDNARNVVMGDINNTVTTGTLGATIGGGGNATFENRVEADFGTIGGGRNHFVAELGGTVSGGVGNRAQFHGTVVGGAVNGADGFWSTVGGGASNVARGKGETVAGGVDNETDSTTGYATVAGGQSNVVTGDYGTVGGGTENAVSGGRHAVVGGGFNNAATDRQATVAGGRGNRATKDGATVGGGFSNAARGLDSTVPGGFDNEAEANYSFAAGRGANAVHSGSFVFGDSSATAISSSGPDEVRSQMPIYAPSFNTTSARARKTAVEPVDPGAVLSGVESLSVSTWEFERDEDDTRHVGPMAGEFNETFEVGDGDGHISSVDADGVALAAIQGLSDGLDEREDRLDDLAGEFDGLDDHRQRVERLAAAVERRDEPVARLETETERKNRRIDALERETDALREWVTDLESRAAEVAGDTPGDVAVARESRR